jgi:hypothetical protein
MWIRTDLAPDTDQLATLRFDAGGSTLDVPIYDVSASTTNVSKAWRFQVGGAVGFAPIVEAGATYPALRHQHNGAVYGTHDSLGARVTVIDGFEDGDVAGWSGESSFQTTTDSIIGDYAATITNRVDGPVAYSLYGDGLNYYPKHGEQVEYYLKDLATGGGANEFGHFYFAVGQSDGTKSGTNGYRVTLETKGVFALLKEYADGTKDELFNISQSIDGRTYRVEIDWLDQKTVRLYDYTNGNTLLQEGSGTDTQFDGNRGVAFARQAAATGATIDEINTNGSV